MALWFILNEAGSSLYLKDWGFCGLAAVKHEVLQSGSDLPS